LQQAVALDDAVLPDGSRFPASSQATAGELKS